MFERFTERARQVPVFAQDEARALKHDYIGTEHLLLGLLREDEGLAARVLASLGVTVEEARAAVVATVGEGEGGSAGKFPFNPEAKKVLELSLREAFSLGHNYIGTEHILLGIVRVEDSVGARILLGLDADAEKVRNEVVLMLGRRPRHGPFGRLPRGRRGGMERDIRRLQRQIERIDVASSPDPRERAYRKLGAARDAALAAGDYDLARKLLELEIEARERPNSSSSADESSAAGA